MNARTIKFISFLLLFVLLKTKSFSQDCQNNLIENPNFENISNSSTYEVSIIEGWNSLFTGNQSSKFYKPGHCIYTNNVPSAWHPTPQNGNHGAFYVTTNPSHGIQFRQGLTNKLNNPLTPGEYKLKFFYSCCGACITSHGPAYVQGNPRSISIYGIKSNGNLPQINPPQSFNSPSNLNIYGNGSTVHISTKSLRDGCGVTGSSAGYKTEIEVLFTIVDPTPITHLMILSSDIPNNCGIPVMVSFDNFCLTKLSSADPCTELARENKKLREELEKCCVRKPKPGIFKPKPKKP